MKTTNKFGLAKLNFVGLEEREVFSQSSEITEVFNKYANRMFGEHTSVEPYWYDNIPVWLVADKYILPMFRDDAYDSSLSNPQKIEKIVENTVIYHGTVQYFLKKDYLRKNLFFKMGWQLFKVKSILSAEDLKLYYIHLGKDIKNIFPFKINTIMCWCFELEDGNMAFTTVYKNYKKVMQDMGVSVTEELIFANRCYEGEIWNNYILKKDTVYGYYFEDKYKVRDVICV